MIYMHLKRLQDREAAWLERDLSLEEVEYVLKLSSSDKAPGPDGFSMGCIKML